MVSIALNNHNGLPWYLPGIESLFKQLSFIVYEVFRNMIQLKWNLNVQFFIEKNVIRNVIAKMSAPYFSLNLF